MISSVILASFLLGAPIEIGDSGDSSVHHSLHHREGDISHNRRHRRYRYRPQPYYRRRYRHPRPCVIVSPPRQRRYRRRPTRRVHRRVVW